MSRESPGGDLMKMSKNSKSVFSKYLPLQKSPESEDHYEPIRPRSSSSWTIPVAVIITILFVIYGVIHYVMNSEPYQLSESFIRQNQTIKAEIGDVDTCDPWFPIEMYPIGPKDLARFTFDVIGKSKQTTEVSVYLQKRQGRWRIISAYYRDRQGFMKPLVEEKRNPGASSYDTAPKNSRVKS